MISTPIASMTSPQSPGRLALVKRRAPAPLQQAAAVVLVVDDVEVLELDVVGVGAVVLVVELVEDDEVVGVGDVVLDVVGVATVVLDVELVDVVGVGAVVDVVVGCSVVDVVPGPPKQDAGGGASFRRSSVSLLSTVAPPNRAQ